jgi:hypothetical protein
MKFELQNRKKPGFLSKITDPFSDRPTTYNAAKSGNPQAETFKPGMPEDVPAAARGNTAAGTESTVTIGTPNRDILNTAPDARPAAGTTPPAASDTSTDKPAADKPADKPAAPNAATNTVTATATAPEGAPDSSIAVTAANANARLAALKKAKLQQQKAAAPKRRPKPADRKSTAPAPAAPPAQTSAPAPAPAAKTAGNGGGVPQP